MPLGENKVLEIFEETLQAAKINTNIDSLLYLLNNFKEQLDGFDYRVTSAAESNEITSFVFQTGHMRRRLCQFGDVCFLDASHSTNSVLIFF